MQGRSACSELIQHEGAQVGAERRTRLKAVRRRGFETARATPTDTALQSHTRVVRLDLRTFDPVIGLYRHLRRARYIRQAGMKNH
jgi:hypothetical protein